VVGGGVGETSVKNQVLGGEGKGGEEGKRREKEEYKICSHAT